VARRKRIKPIDRFVAAVLAALIAIWFVVLVFVAMLSFIR
jgi:hypothetical protein